MKNVTSDNFKSEVLDSTIPVLVDFWADWCRPCQLISPLLEKLSTEYQGKVKFTKVSAEDESLLSKTYGVSSLPTLLIIKSGKVEMRLIGLQNEKKLKEVLDSL